MNTLSVFERLVISCADAMDPIRNTGRPRSLKNTEAIQCMTKLCRTGAQWREVDTNVCFITVFRRMQQWMHRGIFEKAYRKLIKIYKKIHPPHITVSTLATSRMHSEGKEPAETTRIEADKPSKYPWYAINMAWCTDLQWTQEIDPMSLY